MFFSSEKNLQVIHASCLKSIYLPFKNPFSNFSVFMMDIGTFQRAVKAFRDFFSLYYNSLVFHCALGARFWLRLHHCWLKGLFKSIGFLLPKNGCKCVLQSSCNCLLFHFSMLLFKKKKKSYFLLLKRKKKRGDSQVLIHYL